MNNNETLNKVDDYDDSLAVIMEGPNGDIPAEGWPEKFKPEVIGRLLTYMPED